MHTWRDLTSDSALGTAGNREAALELSSKGKEHAQLAKEARHRANQAAYDSCNLTVTNRFKVGSGSNTPEAWSCLIACHKHSL